MTIHVVSVGIKVPIVNKVTIKVNRQCSKCDADMAVGSVAVKDKRNKETQYYHTECPKQRKIVKEKKR